MAGAHPQDGTGEGGLSRASRPGRGADWKGSQTRAFFLIPLPALEKQPPPSARIKLRGQMTPFRC